MKRKQMKTERKKQSKIIEKLNEKHKWADEGMLQMMNSDELSVMINIDHKWPVVE